MSRFHPALLALSAFIVGAAPLSAQIAVLSSTVEEHVAAPGDRYQGTIVVSNASDKQQTARIYQTDYRFAADGTSNFDEPGTTPRSNASWITPQTSRVVVQPHSQATIPYSVVVPRSDSLRGTYWSTIMVEGVAQDNPAAAASNRPSMQLGAVMRYAIQIATHIGSTGTHTIKFMNAAATRAADGGAQLDLDAQNTGERGYRPVLWIEVYDATGALKAKAKQSRGLLYPGTSLHQHFDLGKLDAGTYRAVVFADTGEESVIASQYTVKF